jgi:hypothetical protein
MKSNEGGIMKSWILLLALFAVSYGQSRPSWQTLMIETPYRQFAWVAPQDSIEKEAIEDSDAVYIDTKSPKKAFLLSALVPGAGQLYNGSYIKAVAFLAIEAASWAMYFKNDKKGADIDAEFHTYADKHWSENEYWDYIAKFSGMNRNDVEALRTWEQGHFSHGLHRDKDQQYYEMIGKYDQFNYGWDDSDVGLLDEGWKTALRSKNRLDYEDRRNDSNQAFKTATTMATIAIVNHLFSGLEAAWSSARYNNYQMEASLRLSPRYVDGRPCTALSLNITW